LREECRRRVGGNEEIPVQDVEGGETVKRLNGDFSRIPPVLLKPWIRASLSNLRIP
jgi:hypothetical protein